MIRLALYQPDIPQNLGATIRSCACFGVPLDVIGPCGFPFSLKAVRRAAMDYAPLADLTHHVDWDAFRAQPRRLVLMTTKGARSFWSHRFAPGETVLLGRESAGVPDEVAAEAEIALAIPQPGGGRSLNVAAVAAIVLAEAQRQAMADASAGPGA